jgi:hypothetical protein
MWFIKLAAASRTLYDGLEARIKPGVDAQQGSDNAPAGVDLKPGKRENSCALMTDESSACEHFASLGTLILLAAQNTPNTIWDG